VKHIAITKQTTGTIRRTVSELGKLTESLGRKTYSVI